MLKIFSFQKALLGKEKTSEYMYACGKVCKEQSFADYYAKFREFN